MNIEHTINGNVYLCGDLHKDIMAFFKKLKNLILEIPILLF